VISGQLRYLEQAREWQGKQEQRAKVEMMRETKSEFRKQQRIKNKFSKEYANGIWARQPKTNA
jgi:hypothetical protein